MVYLIDMEQWIRYIFSFSILITLVCGSFLHITTPVYADQVLQNAQADKVRLETELSALEQEIAQKQLELISQKGQSVSLSRDIAILTTQIKKSKLDISAKNLIIKKLGGEIIQKNQQIQTLTTKIESEKESLAQLIRKNRELDDKSLITFILSSENMSLAYGDINTFASIKSAIKKSVHEINGTKVETETQKKTLEIKKNQETDVKVELENAKKQVELTEQNKQQLLSISKDKEQSYQKILADKAKRRSEILAVLFNLRDAAAIPFGKALEYATQASKVTGVRPAFILAIITQESNLGTDQGSCYVTDMTTGVGISSKSNKVYRNVMKPVRDTPVFTDITIALGRDPYKTLVSCPIASAGSSSWGGAMGPAQFIPSTWKGISKRVASSLGLTIADPWNPRDSITASALFLEDLGASTTSYTSEIKAACKYYGSGGSTCAYGRNVMAKADKIQKTMIDPLQN